MNDDDLEKHLDRSGHGIIEVLSQYFSGGSKENHKKLVRIAGFLDEAQTEHLLNTVLPSCSVGYVLWASQSQS
jgi:hypothetical protein